MKNTEELQQYLDQLKAQLGEEAALKIYKLQTNLDKYLFRFKKEMNSLLDIYGYEVLCGIAYKEKDSK